MPRSPSRDLSDRYDGNRRYFARPERLRRDRYALAALALVAAAVWVAADVGAPERAAYAHTHGELANPHAAWDHDCSACHRTHSPSEFGVRAVFRAGDRWHDFTCERCHAGPAHTANVAPGDGAFHDRCSNCHHDHGGRDRSLVRMTDSHCTRCHADLAPHHVAGRPRSEGRVTNFVTDHPEFRPLISPPNRTLKFSHALHMTPGQSYTPGGKEATTLAKVRERGGEAALARYLMSGQSDADLVSLDCASCHRLDPGNRTPEFGALLAGLGARGEPAKSVLPARPSGANFLPVNFELHCRACHPLRAGEGASGGTVIPGFDLSHRLPGDALPGVVRAGYLRGLVATDNPALAAPADSLGWFDPRPGVAARSIRDEVERMTDAALSTLITAGGGCAKCHDLDGTMVAPVPDRTVWLTGARFDHTAHRATSCYTCHPNTTAAFAPPGTMLVEKESVQILGIDSCRACHAPAGTKVTRPDGSEFAGGGVRHGCTDCHNYHNADHALQGRGAAARFPAHPMNLAEFFRPTKDRP